MESRDPRLAAAIDGLIHRTGRMAELGAEDGVPKLDWVDGVARLLAHPSWLEDVEAEADAIHTRGIRHIIWAGMGGSVMAVRVLVDMGFGDGAVTIHPLDSTDPAALNRIVERIAGSPAADHPTHVSSSSPDTAAYTPGGPYLAPLLRHVLMIGVSMGMTSEEPITHLRWFTGLLSDAGLNPSDHLLVMTLPGSYLDRFAREQHAPSRPLQLDGGTGTGGRMSAPTTRVFLLPVALWLAGSYPRGTLRAVLAEAWRRHDLAGAARRPEQHPFVRLATALAIAARDGRCRLLLDFSSGWEAMLPWIEQLMEESLGKGGKGVVVFPAQEVNRDASPHPRDDVLRVWVGRGERAGWHTLAPPPGADGDALRRLSGIAVTFLGWQLAMALFGYRHEIPFAGQPAVEEYKARAGALREDGDPLLSVREADAIVDGRLMLLVPPWIERPSGATPRAIVRDALQGRTGGELSYVDVTVNGESPPDWEPLWERVRGFVNARLGVPLKLRRAPAAYHSTEQSEMDGPPGVASLRVLTTDHERCRAGEYTDTFLRAQAVATWQAMVEAGRVCFLIVIDGGIEEIPPVLEQFFSE